MVSPTKPLTRFPLHVNSTGWARSIRSQGCSGSLTAILLHILLPDYRLLRTRRRREPGLLHVVRVRVPLGQEPVLARAAEPPLALRAPDVAPEVNVLVQLAYGRGRNRALRRLACAAKLVDLARAAVGTG